MFNQDYFRSRNYLLTGSLDGFVKLWLLQGTINTRPLETYTVGNRINAVCFNPVNFYFQRKSVVRKTLII